jgi:tetratricopeptide (TPR) repeat protein
MATPEWEKVEALADLAPAIERYHTLAGLGRFDDAFLLFRDRLEQATLYRLAAYRERIAWLERLFPDGVANLPALTSQRDQSYALNTLAMSYEFSGQPSRSMPLYRRGQEIDERAGDVRNRRTDLLNLGDTLREIGALREATGALLQAMVLTRELEDEGIEGNVLRDFGKVLGSTGAQALAHIALSRSRQISLERGNRQAEGTVNAEFAQLALRVGDLFKAGTWADDAWGWRRCEGSSEILSVPHYFKAERRWATATSYGPMSACTTLSPAHAPSI